MTQTNGGASIEGNVQAGGNVIGRDSIVIERLVLTTPIWDNREGVYDQLSLSSEKGKTVAFPQEQEHALFNLPFGEVTCETEVARLRHEYRSYYYGQSRFNTLALETDRYLIVGRRGAGKTSLTQYFEFQEQLPHATYILVRQLDKFFDLWRQVAERSSYGSIIAISQLESVWEYSFWMLMFHQLRHEHTLFSHYAVSSTEPDDTSAFMVDMLVYLLQESKVTTQGIIGRYVEQVMRTESFQCAQCAVLKIAEQRPLLLAVDTMEKYGVYDDPLMKSTAALIQCAAKFNVLYASCGINMKVFVAAEVFPHLRESVVANTTKYIQNPLYLHWRPKDLLRLITWRLYRYLQADAHFQQYVPKKVHWENFHQIKELLWYPFFGRTITNAMGQIEDTFPYLLRHTQMRPRQMVYFCNAIARETLASAHFPQFQTVNVQAIIRQSERDLAEEVLNSYSDIYPNVAEIVSALLRSPQMFKANYLDKVAKQTSAAWPERHTYSLSAFRRLVTELGIVGRVRRHDIATGIVTADFEYMVEDRLMLQNEDDCVIHPLFYTKLETRREHHLIVYPFPDHPDFEELLQ